MKKISYLLLFVFLVSCTSNTIFKKPEDLIPKDTMMLLIEDMMIASSSKFVKNKNNESKINYMSFVYDKYKIDSSRFKRSNFYYISEIDLYGEMIDDVKKRLEEKKSFYKKISDKKDSITNDSILKSNKILLKVDSIKGLKKK
ncbi:DUF4296 domain-containing protein [Polaribacter sargassicola]|uniref:DUF4296 domain-containing protein n=1 Tax=Polaribacter sargassicola TaxID=2836891 RepID=UPI001F4615EC|nr:DUF4296 domain-containing protein [Polaribacter sp. DS7-9]MCG1034980.1 DUF4296 domain-containing protein [Polaribacter sp. DS7-9]